MDIRSYHRIVIVGSGGSGKSWLATRLADVTGLPLFHLDKELWQPGWVMPPREQIIARQRQIISGDSWIIDGNYNDTMALRFAAADLVIFLDVNRVTCVMGAMRRAGKKRNDLPDFLQEPKVLSKDSIDFYKWIWQYPNTGRKAVFALHEQYENTSFLHIHGRREMRQLVSQWRAQADCRA